MGEFRAVSETARMKTGDVAIERGGLIFARGVTLYTRVLAPRRGADLIARDGDSYAAAVLGPSELQVELRRVNEQVLTGDAQSLCGAEAPAYVALVHDARATSVTLLAFAGEEAPGPDATQSRLCGAYGYAAPDGARTREGVLLR